MEGVQTLLIVVVSTLTILLIVVGLQVFLIIVDLRKAIKRMNNLLEDAILGGGLIKPDKLTGIIEMIKKNKNMTSHGQR